MDPYQLLHKKSGGCFFFAESSKQRIYFWNVDDVDDTTEFLDANRDHLNLDIILLCNGSNDHAVSSFLRDHPSAAGKATGRPTHIAEQYKKQVHDLMGTLNKCSQHYIRCIKSNSHKSAGSFEDQLVTHQVRYLGLVENVKVRRAGFCFRTEYARFIQRYMMLSPTTWRGGHWRGDGRQGSEYVLKAVGMKPGEYQCGKTKLFVKDAEGLFKLEIEREKKRNKAASTIQEL